MSRAVVKVSKLTRPTPQPSAHRRRPAGKPARFAASAGLLLVATLQSPPAHGQPTAPAEAPATMAWTWRGEARLIGQMARARAAGPLHQAGRWQPALDPGAPDTATAALELQGQAGPATANLLLAQGEASPGTGTTTARFNELQLSGEWGGWQWSAGKKVVSWDVGYGFRPNDVVAQEARRLLLTTTPEGRPLLQAEWFGSDDALSLVWVQPQHAGQPADRQRGAEESALAARAYHRDGATDWHGVARWGEHTGASLGLASVWVATDELALHASARWLQRHDGWAGPGPAGPLLWRRNPWQMSTLGPTRQWLLGAQWTGADRLSLLAEAWHDGSAPSDGQWRAWQRRNQALTRLASRPGVPAGVPQAAAGNLAWQATPLAGAGPRQDNVFLRLAWQPDPWQWTLDTLWQPADGGRIVTAGLTWQGDRWRAQVSARHLGGPLQALMAQLPVRHQVLASLLLAF